MKKVKSWAAPTHVRFINRQIAQRKSPPLREESLVSLLYRGEIAFTTASNLQNFVQNHNDETNVSNKVIQTRMTNRRKEGKHNKIYCIK